MPKYILDSFRRKGTLILLYFYVFFFTSCQNDLNKVKEFNSKESIDADVVTNISMVYNEKGNRRAIIIAPEMNKQNMPEKKMIFPKGVQIFFYDNDKQVCTLNAGYAENNILKKELIASQNVKIKNIKGETLSTPTLTWYEQTKKIIAPQSIDLYTQTEHIRGINFISDETFSNYTLEKITGVFSIKEK